MGDKKMTGLTSIIKIVNGFRYFGAGCKVTRSIYKFPETYWIITRVKLSTDQDHGKVYGRMVWRGRPKGREERIGPARKPDWKLLEIPNYHTFKNKQENIDSIMKDIEDNFMKNGVWVNPPTEMNQTAEIDYI